MHHFATDGANALNCNIIFEQNRLFLSILAMFLRRFRGCYFFCLFMSKMSFSILILRSWREKRRKHEFLQKRAIAGGR
jgi:hypothetical protein